MDLQKKEMLRIFDSEKSRYGHRPLYEEIVREARLREMAGVKVMRGLLSCGHDLLLMNSKAIEFGSPLPVVIEIIDHAEKHDTSLPVLERMVRD
ncbi:MAG: DUF190 domain-containing protein [Chlorobiaceae bacterium]|nr:DUF190 domain-containing protein [Chlorobiaceae bacterium]